jgi:hypothetical protein
MFSFFKKRGLEIKNTVWLTNQALYRSMLQEAMKALTENQQPVIITFFKDVQQGVRSFIDEHAIPHSVIQPGDSLPPSGLLLINVVSFNLNTLINQFRSHKNIRFFIRGRYPVKDKEQEWFQSLQQVSAAPIGVHLSMDDPFFELFGGEKLKELIQRMGMKEDECFENNMIDRSIVRGIEKLSGITSTMVHSDSEKEWYSRHLKK